MSMMPCWVFSTQESWPQIWLSPMNSMRISPSVRSSRSRANSRQPCPLDQQVARVEAGGAELQRVLWPAFAKAFLVGGFSQPCEVS